MAPRSGVEFVILRLAYVPYVHPLYPRMCQSRKKHAPTASITSVRDWFDRIMSQEKAQLPPNTHVRYCEWRITSGNADMFTVNEFRFDKILLVMGEESIYWLFYQNMPMQRRFEGSAALPLVYCSCCLNTRYLGIMQIVKNYVENPLQRQVT